MEVVKTILRYLKETTDREITYGGLDQEDLLVKGYSDSDWAGEKESRKLTFSFIFMLNGGPVSRCSKRQPKVALSSSEAEYITLTLADKKATWHKLLQTELGVLKPDQQDALIKVSQNNISVQSIQRELRDEGEGRNELTGRSESGIVVPLKGDNQGSIALAHNLVFHS